MLIRLSVTAACRLTDMNLLPQGRLGETKGASFIKIVLWLHFPHISLTSPLKEMKVTSFVVEMFCFYLQSVAFLHQDSFSFNLT